MIKLVLLSVFWCHCNHIRYLFVVYYENHRRKTILKFKTHFFFTIVLGLQYSVSIQWFMLIKTAFLLFRHLNKGETCLEVPAGAHTLKVTATSLHNVSEKQKTFYKCNGSLRSWEPMYAWKHGTWFEVTSISTEVVRCSKRETTSHNTILLCTLPHAVERNKTAVM